MTKTSLYRLSTVLIGFMWIISACGARGDNEANKVEVFSWWTSGGEAASLEALNQVFNNNYPGVEFVNAATQNTEASARRTLVTRLQGNQPPDSWQGHAGQELIGAYVAEEQIVPLNDLYKEEAWLDVMPKLLFPLISQDGNIYSLPLSIHRTNLLWYNPAVLEASDIAPPVTLDDWFIAMDDLQAAGVTPLALGDSSTRLQLLDTILLATLGPQVYSNLWDGSADWNSPDVTLALQNYQRALDFADLEADSLSWQDAAQLVANGDAAFYVMGDWIEPYFRGLGKKPETDYDWMPLPGTEGVFQFTADSFVLATNAPHRENTINWLKVVGSKEGQETFNAINGSICARTDCNPSLFGEYQLSAMKDWSSNTIAGSLAYGVVANDTWKSGIERALHDFLDDNDAVAFQAALAKACQDSGACKTSPTP